MGSIILKRLLVAVPSLIGVVIVTFLLTRALPGDPAAYFAGPAATSDSIAETRHRLGLDRGLPEQFLLYVEALAKGDLGNSLTSGQTVLDDLRNRLPARLASAHMCFEFVPLRRGQRAQHIGGVPHRVLVVVAAEAGIAAEGRHA